MKAAIVRDPGGVPEYGDFPDPVPGQGRELVTLVAAGLHWVVRSRASGRHYSSSGGWPLIPGVDAVARREDGSVVYTGYVRPPYGTFAERMSVPSGLAAPLPAGADPVKVAAGMNPGLSSWMPLRARAAEVGELGRVLVLGATGMAGSLAVQSALHLGATQVLAAGRNREGLERLASLGATVVQLQGERAKDAAALSAALDGDSPSLVLDYLWGGVAEAAFDALSGHSGEEDRGDIAYVEIGALAGPEARLPSALLRSRRLRISGTGLGATSVADLVAQLPPFLQLIADGSLEVPARTFPLSQIAEAWKASTEGGPRVVVVPG